MDAATKNRIQVKIFVGFELKIDISISLNKNSLWKEAEVSKTSELQEVRYQEKNYIGRFLSHEIVTMINLQEITAKVREELQAFCPEKDLSTLKIQIFPQVFIA